MTPMMPKGVAIPNFGPQNCTIYAPSVDAVNLFAEDAGTCSPGQSCLDGLGVRVACVAGGAVPWQSGPATGAKLAAWGRPQRGVCEPPPRGFGGACDECPSVGV